MVKLLITSKGFEESLESILECQKESPKELFTSTSIKLMPSIVIRLKISWLFGA